MKCLNCKSETEAGAAFCSGACKHEYRSGKDPNMCAHCQDRPATHSKSYEGYCSVKCKRMHNSRR